MRPQSYIGVTGFMRQQEVNEVASVLPADSKRLLMVGVLASSRTLCGEENKYPNRYPKKEHLASIFAGEDRKRFLNLVHLSVDEPETLADDMLKAIKYGGPWCHGLQLNVVWPNKDTLSEFRTTHPAESFKIVLQIGAAAMGQLDNDPKKIAAVVRENYATLVDYVLIDSSGGRGKDFDTTFAGECIKHLADVDTIGIGVAGGLSPENVVDRLGPFLKLYPGTNWDVEGKLRRRGNDTLIIPVAQDFVSVSDAIAREHSHEKK